MKILDLEKDKNYIKNPFYESFLPFIIYKDCYFIKKLYKKKYFI